MPVVRPTWEDRDLPVLRAILEIVEETGRPGASPSEIMSRTNFDAATVKRAINALRGAEPPLLGSAARNTAGNYLMVGAPTERARRAVGLWPTPEEFVDRAILALDRAADEAATEEERSSLKNAARYLGGLGRSIATEVMAKAIAGGVS